jgi:hypothetical protein
MFYSRPKIEPLGWDLTGWPVSDGCKHFEATTSDSRPVDIRFSGGWITVCRGPAHASPESADMEEVLSIRISPFGIMDIEPEQICDILGLTVNGHKIDSAGMRIGARGYDWSGRTTYWESTHRMLDRDDPRIFIQRLCDTFPGSMLVQPEWGDHGQLRCRRVKFLLASDEIVTLGIQPDDVRLAQMLSGEKISTENYESTFTFSIEFSRRDRLGDDITGSGYVHQSGGAALGLNYDVIHHLRYRVTTQYLTEDLKAQSRMAKLKSLIDAYFCRSLQMVNLQTQAIMAEEMPDEQDDQSYSIALRDSWLERPKRYLFVGRTHREDGSIGPDSVFYGARPIASAPE